jgi:hypothetical protein
MGISDADSFTGFRFAFWFDFSSCFWRRSHIQMISFGARRKDSPDEII